MEPKKQKDINLDILKHLENLSNQINMAMQPHAKAVFHRYPIAFGLFILLGVIILNEGLKGVLREMGLLNIDPWYLITIGIVVLIITGTVYKKLNK